MTSASHAGVGGCEKYRAEIEKYDGWNSDIMIAICELESGGVPTASNWKDSHDGCNGSFGILQVACVHGVAREDLYDPATNIRVAHGLWKERGYVPWTTYQKILAFNE